MLFNVFSSILLMQKFQKENDNDDNEKRPIKRMINVQNQQFTRKQKIIFYIGIFSIYLILFLIYYFFLRDIFPKPRIPSIDDF